MNHRALMLLSCMACFASAAKAHEFWIDPVAHQVKPGAQVQAHLKVGQDFEGSNYSFVPSNFVRFDMALGGEVQPMPGTVGDRPAVNVVLDGEGLLTVIHQTTDQHLTWSTWDKFASFLEHKDLTHWVAEHDARGLSRMRVRERYSRYAKSLIGVGTAAGSDITAGLQVEIVALENPYTGDMSDGIDIQAIYDRAPMADTQIEVYEKASDGTVRVFLGRTDEAGLATIPVTPGHRYMLDAVVLRPLQAVQDTDPVWESLWANLTFEVPEN